MAGSGTRAALAADGNTAAITVSGPVRLSLTGAFGSGTAKLQATDPGGNWVDVDGGSFTDVTDTVFDFPAFAFNNLRVNLASATDPALVVWIQSSKQTGD